eukprot:4354221-Alexandrium_andersonii.AAC.1
MCIRDRLGRTLGEGSVESPGKTLREHGVALHSLGAESESLVRALIGHWGLYQQQHEQHPRRTKIEVIWRCRPDVAGARQTRGG